MPGKKIKPWDLLTNYLDPKEAGRKEIFRQIQEEGGKLSGIIIAFWEGTNPLPTRYVDETTRLGNDLPHLLGSEGMFPRFNDPTRRQSPRMYQSLGGIHQAVRTLRIEYKKYNQTSRKPRIRVGLYMWKHPEREHKSLLRYNILERELTGKLPP